MRSLLLLVLLATAGFAQSVPSLLVEGLGSRTVTLSLDEIKTLPRESVKTTDRGRTVQFDAVKLKDVLSKVELPLGEKYHLTAASHFLVAEAKDGYRVVFAWAEVDSTYMDKPIYVALSRDGKPFGDKTAPFQLVVPGEKRGGRWVRQLTALRLRQAR